MMMIVFLIIFPLCRVSVSHLNDSCLHCLFKSSSGFKAKSCCFWSLHGCSCFLRKKKLIIFCWGSSTGFMYLCGTRCASWEEVKDFTTMAMSVFLVDVGFLRCNCCLGKWWWWEMFTTVERPGAFCWTELMLSHAPRCSPSFQNCYLTIKSQSNNLSDNRKLPP